MAAVTNEAGREHAEKNAGALAFLAATDPGMAWVTGWDDETWSAVAAHLPEGFTVATPIAGSDHPERRYVIAPQKPARHG